MDPALVPWLLLPLVGGLIGFATNWLAIRMLFRPRRPVLGFQGLLPRRQAELAERVGAVIAEDLVKVERLIEPLEAVDLCPHVEGLIDEVIESKFNEYRAMPLIGSFLKPEMLDGLKRSVIAAIDRRQPAIKRRLAEEVVGRVDIAALAREELAGLDLDGLERATLRIAHRELRAIEWWGALLGALIGLAQAGCLHLLPASA